jgi:hypothetical protein
MDAMWGVVVASMGCLVILLILAFCTFLGARKTIEAYTTNICDHIDEHDLALLQVKEPPFEKVRVGGDGDGGYVMCLGFEYDLLLSAGISDDVSMENDFLRAHPSVACHAFDGTIDALPVDAHPNIIFHQQNIGNGPGENDMTSLIDAHERVMLKMDIEGAEWDWIRNVSREQLGKIVQIVMEFHTYASNVSFDTIRKLLETHWLVHFHANNYGNYSVCGSTNTKVPDIFECTFLLKSAASVPETLPCTQKAIPGELDRRNVPWNEEIALEGWPYTC